MSERKSKRDEREREKQRLTDRNGWKDKQKDR